MSPSSDAPASTTEPPMAHSNSSQGRPSKPHTDSDFRFTAPAYPAYLNELGHVKAGHVMKLMDLAAGITSRRHLGEDFLTVTAAMDRTDFTGPIHAWEIMNIDSRLTQVWNTSMEVKVTVEAWNFDTNETRQIAHAYFVMAALTHDRLHPDPSLIPTLDLETDEDRELAAKADAQKAIRKQEGKEVPIIPIDQEDPDPVVIERLMTPIDANTMNNVFGGTILAIIHKAGRLAALRQAQGATTVGVRQDRMSFLAPVFIGETVRTRALITRTWNTSMEVQVEVEAINSQTWEARSVARSYLVYVCLDNQGVPQAVPPLVAATSLQRERAEAADKRRANREQEQNLGLSQPNLD